MASIHLKKAFFLVKNKRLKKKEFHVSYQIRNGIRIDFINW